MFPDRSALSRWLCAPLLVGSLLMAAPEARSALDASPQTRLDTDLRKLLCRVCQGDQGRADDLAQEAFMRAWRALPGFRGEARFRTWLTRRAYPSLAAERPRLPQAEESATDDVAQSDFAPGIDRRTGLDRALATLTEPQRHALLLTCGADLSQAEAAQVLGWPLGTVKTQVLRAKARLRAHLSARETPE